MKKSKLQDIEISASIYTVEDLKANFQEIQELSSPESSQEDIVMTINKILSAFTQIGDEK